MNDTRARSRDDEGEVRYCRALGIELRRIGYSFETHTGYLFLFDLGSHAPTVGAARRVFDFLDPLCHKIVVVRGSRVSTLWAEPAPTTKESSDVELPTIRNRSGSRVPAKRRRAGRDA
jgi:hypothetical protein